MASSYKKVFPITWDQVHRDAKILAHKLLETKKTFTCVVAVARGGLVPAAIVARELNIHMVETVCVFNYATENTQSEETILKSLSDDGEGFIVIDDLVDTGKTAQIIRNMLPKAHFATLYSKPVAAGLVDTFITQVHQDTWILFPWDSEVQFAKPLADIG